jgi:hypothetical protein
MSRNALEISRFPEDTHLMGWIDTLPEILYFRHNISGTIFQFRDTPKLRFADRKPPEESLPRDISGIEVILKLSPARRKLLNPNFPNKKLSRTNGRLKRAYEIN